MKKRRILYLLPFATLILGGCTLKDVKSWVGKNVYFPVRNWVDDFLHPTHAQPQEEKLDEKALFEAFNKTVSAQSATSETYLNGELARKIEFGGQNQFTYQEITFYYEEVNDVTYVFYLNTEDQSWTYFTATQEPILGLNFTSEDIESLKTFLHDEKNTVEYGEDYCLITPSEDSVLADVIEQYPDYEATIRETYKASEVKSGVKLIVKDGYLASWAEFGVEVIKNEEDTEGTSFVCNVETYEEKISKVNSTVVARPEGITSVPPEE